MIRLLRTLAAWLPRRDILGVDGTPYLTRYALLGTLGGKGWKVVLHQFHRGDEDRELHNHPWSIGLSFVLVGGYIEVRRGHDGRVRTRHLPPWSLNVIWPETFHRVTLPRGECWSLLFLGARVQEWGFLDVATGRFTPWQQFVPAGVGVRSP